MLTINKKYSIIKSFLINKLNKVIDMKKKIRKIENGHVRIIELNEFLKKMVEKKVIGKADKFYYLKNPNSLCDFLNQREKKFGVQYSLI